MSSGTAYNTEKSRALYSLSKQPEAKLADAQLLLEAGADPHQQSLWNGMSVADHFIRNGNVEAVKLLLRHGLKLNGDDGESDALLFACSLGRTEIVKALLESGAAATGEAVASAHKSGDAGLVRLVAEAVAKSPVQAQARDPRDLRIEMLEQQCRDFLDEVTALRREVNALKFEGGQQAEKKTGQVSAA